MKKIIFLLLYSVYSLSGGWTGVGGGLSSYDQENIWFIGDEAIPYCIIRSKKAPPKASLNIMIQRNAEKWRSFFSRYELDQINLGKDNYRRFPDKIPRKLSLHFEESTSCDSIEKFCDTDNFNEEQCNQSLRHTVLFLVGKKNKVVEKFIEMNGPGIGAAIRTEYNHLTYRSGGIVWVENPIDFNQWGWSQYSHILLHEMGHVLGMKHDSCWVMATKIASIIKNSTFATNFLEKVESANWPFSFKIGDILEFTDAKSKYTNKMISIEGLKILDFDQNNNFKVWSEIIEKSSDLRLKMNIYFEEIETKKRKKFSGVFTGNYEFSTNQGPSLYTWWLDEKDRKSLFSENISRRWNGQFYKGVVSLTDNKGIEQSIPVNFYKDKGLRLDVYFPNSTDWLSIVSQIWIVD
jgi:hypothetical protein